MRTELYWITTPTAGRLAIMPRPRGGDWLEDEIRSWRSAGVDIVLSLLTAGEVDELNLAQEEALCKAQDIDFFGYPIVDRSVPSSKESALRMLTKLRQRLVERKNIAIHCRQGIGRAALIAIGLLILAGLDPETAIANVGAARGCPVPETPEQKRWIVELFNEPMVMVPK